MLSYLIYISTRSASCTEEKIERIISQSCHFNKANDITGVLLYSQSNFLQYIEGDYYDVFELQSKIKRDSRHRNMITLTCRPINCRQFNQWHMIAKSSNNDVIKSINEIIAREHYDFSDFISSKSSYPSIELLRKMFKEFNG